MFFLSKENMNIYSYALVVLTTLIIITNTRTLVKKNYDKSQNRVAVPREMFERFWLKLEPWWSEGYDVRPNHGGSPCSVHISWASDIVQISDSMEDIKLYTKIVVNGKANETSVPSLSPKQAKPTNQVTTRSVGREVTEHYCGYIYIWKYLDCISASLCVGNIQYQFITISIILCLIHYLFSRHVLWKTDRTFGDGLIWKMRSYVCTGPGYTAVEVQIDLPRNRGKAITYNYWKKIWGKQYIFRIQGRPEPNFCHNWKALL